MSKEEILEGVKDAIVELKGRTKLVELVKQAFDAGISAKDLIEEIRQGMEIVGKKYEEKEYFIGDLIMASSIVKGAMEVIDPQLKLEGAEVHGKVLIGTVRGDLHDIGKNSVSAAMKVAGFDVIDLGIDIPISKFIEKLKEINPDILGLSALLTSTMPQMSEVIKAITEEGLRDKIKVMIGGRPVTEGYAKEIGADAYGGDALDAVNKARELV